MACIKFENPFRYFIALNDREFFVRPDPCSFSSYEKTQYEDEATRMNVDELAEVLVDNYYHFTRGTETEVELMSLVYNYPYGRVVIVYEPGNLIAGEVYLCEYVKTFTNDLPAFDRRVKL